MAEKREILQTIPYWLAIIERLALANEGKNYFPCSHYNSSKAPALGMTTSG